MDRRLFPLVVVLALLAGGPRAAARADGAGMGPFPLRPEECRVEPRSEEEIRALLPTSEVDAAALQAEFRAADLPDGAPAGPETLAGVAAAAREFGACQEA